MTPAPSNPALLRAALDLLERLEPDERIGQVQIDVERVGVRRLLAFYGEDQTGRGMVYEKEEANG